MGRWLPSLDPQCSGCPISGVNVPLRKTACLGLWCSRLTAGKWQVQQVTQGRTGMLALPRVVRSLGCDHKWEMTLIAVLPLSRCWYLPVSHLCRSGPPASILPTGWYASLLSRPLLASGFEVVIRHPIFCSPNTLHPLSLGLGCRHRSAPFSFISFQVGSSST